MSALKFLAQWVYLSWLLVLVAGLVGQLLHLLNGRREGARLEVFHRACGRLHQELWLFAPPGLLLGVIHNFWSPGMQWHLIFDAINVYNWWAYRNWPEDNHWKRRAKKAKEAVAVRAGRLVVVPVGTSS